MIRLLRSGRYQLYETKANHKILVFDAVDTFAWIEVGGLYEILVTSHKKHRADCMFSRGQFRLYEVENEPRLVDQQHLELEVGEGAWQGYLLPSGLPDDIKLRHQIIPTQEIVGLLRL